jgi:hypothetical protein
MRKISEARLRANRANARLSTGARTPTGKMRSSQNAVRHGLFGRATRLEGEERQAYLDFTGAIVNALEPGTAMERQLAERTADQEWRLTRLEEISEAVLEGDEDQGEEPTDPIEAAAREFRERPTGLATLSLYEQRLTRMAREARKELREMQAARQAREQKQMQDAVGFYKLHKMIEKPWMPEVYGFVFSTEDMEHEIWLRSMRHTSLVASTYDYNREKWQAAHPKKQPAEAPLAESEAPPVEKAS